MSAYIIAFVDIHDRTRFAQDYVPPIASTLEPFGGRVVAASDEPTTLEGSVPPGRGRGLTPLAPDPGERGWCVAEAAQYRSPVRLRPSVRC